MVLRPLFCLMTLLLCISPASAQRVINTTSDQFVFIGTNGLTYEYARIYVPDNGRPDPSVQLQLQYAGLGGAEYVSLTNNSLPTMLADTDMVVAVQASVLEQGFATSFFTNPETSAFIVTAAGIEGVIVQRSDGLVIENGAGETVAPSTLPVVSAEDGNVVIIAYREELGDFVDLVGYRIRPDEGYIRSSLEASGITLGNLSDGSDSSLAEPLARSGTGLFFLAPVQGEPPLRAALEQLEDVSYYAVLSVGVVPVALATQPDQPSESILAESEVAVDDPSREPEVVATVDPSARVTEADFQAASLEIAAERFAAHEGAPWLNLDGTPVFVALETPVA